LTDTKCVFSHNDYVVRKNGEIESLKGATLMENTMKSCNVYGETRVENKN